MAINPLIALQNQRATPNIQPALNQLVEGIRRGPALDERKTNRQANRLAQQQGMGQEQVARIGNAARIGEQLIPALDAGDMEQAQRILQESERIDPQMSQQGLQMLQENPQQLRQISQRAIDTNKRVQQTMPSAKGASPSAVREFQFYQGLNPEQQKQFMGIKRAGFTLGQQRFGPSTDMGSPEVTVPAEQTARGEAIVAASEEAGKSAIKQSNEAIEQLSSVRQNISVLDEGISAIDEGAETGPIYSRLPSVRESSIKLDNVRGRLGLDVIGGTTFGALSESELKFALDTAIPRNLGAKELKGWLQRKKQAQEKLSRELENAAIFLGKPGNTPAEYLELRRQQTQSSQQGQGSQSQGGQQGGGRPKVEFLGWEEE